MKRQSILCAALLLTQLYSSLMARTPNNDIRFSHLSLEDGLSQSTVFTILQDWQGFMWFGTNDGLNRYDGYQFEHFKHDQRDPTSLSDSWVSALMEDKHGHLWVGTFNSGLNRLDEDRKSFTRIDLKLSSSSRGLTQNLVMGLQETKDGKILVGVSGHGIVMIDEQGTIYKHWKHDPKLEGSLISNDVKCLLVSRNDTIWVGTDKGLARYDPSNDTFYHYSAGEASSTLASNSITTLCEAKDGTLWVGTENGGLHHFTPASQTFRRINAENSGLPQNAIQATLIDSDGQLWVGTRSSGLALITDLDEPIINYYPEVFNPDTLRDDTIHSLYEDRGGLIWVGTYSEGLSKFNRNMQGFQNHRFDPFKKTGLSGTSLSAFEQLEDGRLIVGYREGGLSVRDKATGNYTHYKPDPRNPNSISDDLVFDILQDRHKEVWVATENGLNHFDPDRGTFEVIQASPENKLSANHITCLLEDGKDRFWLGTYTGGLNQMDRATQTFQSYVHNPADPASISNNFINHLFEDSLGRLWIGTEYGLNQLLDSGRFRYYFQEADDPGSLHHNSVMTIHQRDGEDDVLWIGTYGGGLDRFLISTASFTHFTTREGLANDSIYGILSDETGHLWISTNNGISRFNPETGRFKNFNTSNGLIRNEFNRGAYYKAPDGEMYFGGTGYTSFYPQLIKRNEYIPPVVLTSIRKDNEELQLRPGEDVLELRPGEHVVSFTFAALDFTSPERNQFTYRLSGFSNDWIDLGTRNTMTYTNLDPGVYNLQIKGSNNDRVWNEEGLKLKIHVIPPIWRTTTAYLIYTLVIACLVFTVFRRRRQESNRELQRAMSLGKAEFATTVLHNIGNVLNSVKVSCDKTAVILRASKVKQLLRAQEMLNQNLDNVESYLKTDPRGKLLPGYFRSAGELVGEEYSEMLHECDEMSEQIALMKDIIETQQVHASLSLMDEAHNLNHVVKDALKVQENGLRNRGIQIEEHLRPLPPVKVPKTQLMHIVINLVKNAREAMETNGEREKKLIMETGRYGDSEVYLKIQDTGVGISRENLSKMFTYGFTTKKDGHGFGLNYCSRAMKEMGGSIEVESEGVGKGATFTLLFRANPTE